MTGPFLLTRGEVGDREWRKADLRRYHGSPDLALLAAKRHGHLALAALDSLRNAIGNPMYSSLARDRFVADAEMFARLAFRGWRAYRFMKGD